jgi:hypothetical protein
MIAALFLFPLDFISAWGLSNTCSTLPIKDGTPLGIDSEISAITTDEDSKQLHRCCPTFVGKHEVPQKAFSIPIKG